LRVEQAIDSPGYVQRQIFFHDAATHCAGVLTPMAWIKNDYREWLGSPWLSRLRFSIDRRSLLLMERNPDKRGDHQQQARDRQHIPEGLFHF
jgi:hypothetical protein